MFKMKGKYNYKWLNSQVVSMGGKEEEIHTPLVLVLTQGIISCHKSNHHKFDQFVKKTTNIYHF